MPVDIVPLVLVGLPLLGAAALVFLGEGYHQPGRDPLPALIAGTVFAAAVLLSEHIPAQVDLISGAWGRIFGSQPAILVDPFALPFVFGLALLAMAATIVGDRLRGRSWAMALLFWGGSLFMVASANWLTLSLSWVVCEAALLGAALLARNSRLVAYRLTVGGAAAAILLILTIRAEGPSTVNLPAALAALSPRWIAALLAVGAVRMGLYPFHLPGLGERDAPLVPLVLGRLSGAMAGLYLWFRILTTMSSLPPQLEYLIVLGGLAILISALAAWGARNERSLFPWLIGFELGVIVVALGFATPQFTVFAALEMLNLVLAGSVLGLSLYAGHRIEGEWGRRWIRGLGIVATASLLGLPPTPGFVARWGMYRRALEAGELAAVLPIMIASGLLVPVLFAARRTPQRRPIPRLSDHAGVGLTILGLPLVLATVQPLILTSVLDAVTGLASYPIMVPLIRSAGPRMSAQVIALIVIPVLAGYSLDGVYVRWRAQGRFDMVWQFLALDWLYELLAPTVIRAAIAVSILLAFLEFNSELGWALAAGLLVVLLLLRR